MWQVGEPAQARRARGEPGRRCAGGLQPGRHAGQGRAETAPGRKVRPGPSAAPRQVPARPRTAAASRRVLAASSGRPLRQARPAGLCVRPGGGEGPRAAGRRVAVDSSMFRKTKMVCTIGPTTCSKENLFRLADAVRAHSAHMSPCPTLTPLLMMSGGHAHG